ncbi:MAG TPA: sensor histidine kinase [Candidatus Limnocylindrales bacterium]|nr:sensor histidine kinase [Candidatus Limnocylindrales bacterium]
MAGRTARASSPLPPLARVPPEERPEVVLRVSVVVLVVLTAVVAFVPDVHAHMVAPAVDLALDTTALVVSVSLTALAWVRFRERREAIGLYHASAFLSLAVAYGSAVALSLGRDAAPETLADPSSPQTWVFAVARILAAILLIVGGTAMRGREPPRPGYLLLLPAGAVIVIALVGFAGPGIAAAVPLLDHDSPPDVLPMTTRAGVVVQLVTATLFFAAALAVRAAWRRDRTVMDAWIAVALVFAGFAEIHWMLYPSGHPGQVASADVLRLACFVALLLGIEAEARVTLARLRTANVELENLRDVEVERAAIEERSRLARELHDGLAQDLWLAKLKTGQVASVPGLPATAQPLLQEAEAAIDNGLTEARQAVLALRLSTAGEEGFCNLMRRYIEDFEDRFGLRVEFSCDGDSGPIAPRTQAEVMRIAQEALTNARQHASPTVVGVRLVIADGRVTLTIMDNGRGFDARKAVAGSFGLVSMRERADLLGGRLHIRSRPGEGTTVLLSVPAAGAPSRQSSAGVPA